MKASVIISSLVLMSGFCSTFPLAPREDIASSVHRQRDIPKPNLATKREEVKDADEAIAYAWFDGDG
ncbi:MAG: hypothetical protein Q9184_002331 [Pyrenodesmia sp. 2 TL-2023]